MKLLILSCNVGGGHNAVADALREIFSQQGASCQIVDALSFLPPGWSRLTGDVHTYTYRNAPDLFRKGYKHAETHRKQFKKWHSTRNLLDAGVNKLGRFIIRKKFDAVLCCHVFAGIMLSDAIKRYRLKIRSGIVETDYTVTPGAEVCNLDWHFVPCRDQAEKLKSFGIPNERLVVSGIPVREQFYHSVPRAEAKSEFGLSPEKKNILISCGSMGCGPMEALVAELDAEKADWFEVCVICGSNKKLFETLTSRYGAESGIHVFSRVENMSAILDSADVYLTKPGGISTTEAAVKGVPMVLVDAVGGCEQYNQDYYVSYGGAVTEHSVSGLVQKALRILENQELQFFMKEQLKKAVSENDREIIRKTL